MLNKHSYRHLLLLLTLLGLALPVGVSAQVATSTTVTSSPNPSNPGDALTLTATVTAITPGVAPVGTITFTVDGSIGVGDPNDPVNNPNPATLTNQNNAAGTATATFQLASPSPGPHTITATYSGGSVTDPGPPVVTTTFSASSGAVTQIVKTATSTALTPASQSSTFGQSVTVTATVTGNHPTGTVTFSEGGTAIGTSPVNGSNVATLTTSSLSVGSHTINAVYNGDSFNAASPASNSVTVSVGQAAAVVTLSVSPNPATVGQSVTFSVSAAGTGGVTPTGTVQLQDGGGNFGPALTLVNGTATFSASGLTAGSHSITAQYGGDGTYTTELSNAVALQINQAATTTTLNSSANPSTFNQTVTFTATIAVSAPGAGSPSGSVQFQDGGSNLGTPQPVVGGQASLSVSSLSVGGHNITAVYGSDANFTGSASAALTQTVAQAASATALASSLNPSNFNQSVTFTATVTAANGSGTPTGAVQFQIDSQNVKADGTAGTGPVPIVNGGSVSINTATLSVGSHTVTATYIPDGASSFSASSSPALTQVVRRTSTTTTLNSDTNPSTFNQPVTFTATVNGVGGTPTGTVTFQDTFKGTTNTIGTGALNMIGGTATATFSTSGLAVGAHSIVGIYGGDTTYSGSFSTDNGHSPLTQTVNASGTSIGVQSSANPSVYHQPITLTATVQGKPGVPPTGTVQFRIDGALVQPDGTPADPNAPAPKNGSIALSGGGSTPSGTFATASIQTSQLPVTTDPQNLHQITVSYSGDNNNAAADNLAAPFSQEVDKAATVATAASSPSPSTFGQPVTLTATVSASPPGSGLPTGTVTFQDTFNGQTKTLGTSALSNGAATLLTSSLAVTPDKNTLHKITVAYSGDGNFNGSTSNPVSQQVFNAQPSTIQATGPGGAPYLLVPGTPRDANHPPLATSDNQTLTVSGDGIVQAFDGSGNPDFNNGAQVVFNGTTLTPTAYGTTLDGKPSVQVALNPALTALAGVATIQVFNPNTAATSALPSTTLPINPVQALPNFPIPGGAAYARMISFPYSYDVFNPYEVLQGVTLLQPELFATNGYNPDVNLLGGLPIGFTNTDTPLYTWDPTKTNTADNTSGLYLTTRPGQAGQNGLLTTDLHFVLGQAYWVIGGAGAQTLGVMRLGTPTQFNPASIVLQKGWNMVGDPFPSATTMSSLAVLYQGIRLPFYGDTGSGVSNGVVSPIFWSYDGTKYQLNYSGLTGHSDLLPFEGYWLYCYAPCTLLVTK